MEMEDMKFLLEKLDKMETRFGDKLDQLIVQTTKTNGKVISLTDRVESLEDGYDGHNGKIETLMEVKNFNHGRDTIIKIAIGAAGTVLIGLGTYYLNKFF
ncbi:MAG: hypothetical protein WC810_14555 [Janthinobacterium sp.]|jgi:hypothetical protein